MDWRLVAAVFGKRHSTLQIIRPTHSSQWVLSKRTTTVKSGVHLRIHWHRIHLPTTKYDTCCTTATQQTNLVDTEKHLECLRCECVRALYKLNGSIGWSGGAKKKKLSQQTHSTSFSCVCMYVKRFNKYSEFLCGKLIVWLHHNNSTISSELIQIYWNIIWYGTRRSETHTNSKSAFRQKFNHIAQPSTDGVQCTQCKTNWIEILSSSSSSRKNNTTKDREKGVLQVNRNHSINIPNPQNHRVTEKKKISDK